MNDDDDSLPASTHRNGTHNGTHSGKSNGVAHRENADGPASRNGTGGRTIGLGVLSNGHSSVATLAAESQGELDHLTTANGHAIKRPQPEPARAGVSGAGLVISPRSMRVKEKFFPEVSADEWCDWKWQLRKRIKSLDDLERFFTLSGDERAAVEQMGKHLPVGITPYYASLCNSDDATEGVRRTMIPVLNELTRGPGEADDPLGEDGDMPVEGLVHRYPDRVLFLVTNFCATYCRYCTRARMVGQTGEYHFNTKQFQAGIDYIAAHPEIRDCLLSGGDPLTMGDDRLEWLLSRLRAIPHLEFIRIGSKVPAVLPQRITSDLCDMLRRYHPLWISIHFMHPNEVTPEVMQACGRLADAGIPLGSQTVLTKGVNDNVETMKALVHKLLMARVRPYYLYQCDPISGSSHFRTPVAKGLEIIRGLRGHTTGYAVPTFVIDGPGGGGKMPLSPEYVVGRDGDDVLLKNFEGQVFRYPDPLPAGQ